MTNIRFLHGAPDRLAAAAEWLRQASVRRQAVLVFVPRREDADRLDRLLWTQPATAFVPHCRADSPLATETPIVLADDLSAPIQDHCLLNLADDMPPAFSRFEELVEIVSTEDEVRLPARERFRIYRERGYALDAQDISGGL